MKQEPGLLFTFKKTEKLKSKTLINSLFEKGNHGATQFPFRILWKYVSQPDWDYSAQVMIGVSIRNFPNSTDRNRIKRQLRELYRLNKHLLYLQLQNQNKRIILSVNYQGKEKLTMDILRPAFLKLFNKLINQIKSDMDQNQ